MPNSGNGRGPGSLPPVGTRGSGPLEAAEASEPSAPAEPAEAAGASAVAGSPTAAIAADLASGAIDAATARARLIEQAVRAQLPPGASPALLAAIRAEVEDLLRDDPVLERLLRP